jgi:hypothetical protein
MVLSHGLDPSETPRKASDGSLAPLGRIHGPGELVPKQARPVNSGAAEWCVDRPMGEPATLALQGERVCAYFGPFSRNP